MNLREYFDNVYRLEHDLRPATIQHHEYTLKSFAEHLGREPTLADLNPPTVNAWLMALQQRYKPATAKTRRIDLLTLWYALYDAELVADPPKRIRVIRLGNRNPIAWTPDEVAKLIAAADKMRGTVAALECARRFFWGTLIRAAWDSALRQSDLFRVMPGDLYRQHDGSAVVCLDQQKTGNSVSVRFSAETVDLVKRFLSLSKPRERIWWPAGERGNFCCAFRRLVASAGIRKGSFKFLRRASITAREALCPGMGSVAAGHTSPEVTRRFYLDKSQLPAAPLPPRARPQQPPVDVTFTSTIGGDQ